MNTPLLQADGLYLGYDQNRFGPLNFRLDRGEALSVFGPNGGGKSTLVRTLCGLIPPAGGRLQFPGGHPRIGYVPQITRLDPLYPLTAAEIVSHPLIASQVWYRRDYAEVARRTDEALALIGLADRASTLFRSLSGGQQQRILIARALALKPELLVLDEPASGLDRESEDQIARLLRTLVEARHCAIVMVSHDRAGASAITPNWLHLDWQKGCIELSGAKG